MSSRPLNDYLPGFASLLEHIDKRVLVLLRDGRSIFGYLRSVDQYVEKIYVGNEYGEIDRGVFFVRGENVVLCGELSTEKDESEVGITKVPIEVILEKQAKQAEERSEVVAAKRCIQHVLTNSTMRTNLEEIFELE